MIAQDEGLGHGEHGPERVRPVRSDGSLRLDLAVAIEDWRPSSIGVIDPRRRIGPHGGTEAPNPPADLRSPRPPPRGPFPVRGTIPEPRRGYRPLSPRRTRAPGPRLRTRHERSVPIRHHGRRGRGEPP